MAIVVVGGQTRKVGKTSVAAGLIAALPEFDWTAIKITRHRHGRHRETGMPDSTDIHERSPELIEEYDRSGQSDTSRFLLAGAGRAYLVQASELSQAMPQIRQLIGQSSNTVIESNGILEFLKPDLCLAVLDPANPDVKQSTGTCLAKADAVVLHKSSTGTEREKPGGNCCSLSTTDKPVFSIQPPIYMTEDIVEFVRSALEQVSHSPQHSPEKQNER